MGSKDQGCQVPVGLTNLQVRLNNPIVETSRTLSYASVVWSLLASLQAKLAMYLSPEFTGKVRKVGTWNRISQFIGFHSSESPKRLFTCKIPGVTFFSNCAKHTCGLLQVE